MRPFWAFFADDAIAVQSDRPFDLANEGLSYSQLAQMSDDFSGLLPGEAGLGFVLAANDVPTVVAYLGALRANRCLALLPQTLSAEQLSDLIGRYRPEWIVAPEIFSAVLVGYRFVPWLGLGVWCRFESNGGGEVHPDTALLLTTSGSTGSPKMVRISYAALASNALAIASYLDLTSSEKAITTLPVSYSYGLSVLNSHLHVGASVLLTDASVMGKEFWSFFKAHQATSIAGVPYTWQMLARLKLDQMGLSSLRTLTQAGGALAESLKQALAEMSLRQGWRFFVMYGQTEACARIAFLPPDQVSKRPGSIGVAIPGGSLSLDPETSELIYQGQNVMMGYADGRDDLALNDQMGGVLRTGDLARLDVDGYFYLTGRIKRIAKIFGNRLNLDEVEALLENSYPGASFAALDGSGVLFLVSSQVIDGDGVRSIVRNSLGIHTSGVRFVAAAIPLTASGKKDYSSLSQALGI